MEPTTIVRIEALSLVDGEPVNGGTVDKANAQHLLEELTRLHPGHVIRVGWETIGSGV